MERVTKEVSVFKPKVKVFKGKDGLYGVDGVHDNATLYEPDMSLEMARRIVQLENEKQDEDEYPRDWEDMAEILDAEGYDA